MTTTLIAYLRLPGTAAEAMEFYRSVLGGELDVDTHASFAEATGTEVMVPPAQRDHVMHAQLTTAHGFQIMAADAIDGMPVAQGSAVALSLVGDAEDKDELTRVYEALAEGGEVHQPLVEAPWGASFGSLTDRFGLDWMINIG